MAVFSAAATLASSTGALRSIHSGAGAGAAAGSSRSPRAQDNSVIGNSFLIPTSFKSAAAEQPLDIGQLQGNIGRPPMVALSGVGRAFHVAQQRIHLIGAEP